MHLTAKVFDNTSGGAGCTLPDAIFFLPPGYGPAGGTEEFDAAGCQGGTYAATNVDVQTDGEVQPPNNGCVSLDGVTFRAG